MFDGSKPNGLDEHPRINASTASKSKVKLKGPKKEF
jgi:hypothetical protein